MGKRASKKKRERKITIKLAADPGSLARRVESALARGDVDGACLLLSHARQSRKAFSAELNVGDRDLYAKAYLAQAYTKWNKPAQALESLDRAIEVRPESAELHRVRGTLLRRLGRTKPAVVELAEARRLAPEDERIVLELLLTRLANGERGADLVSASSSLKGPASDRARALVSAFGGDLPSAERTASASSGPIGKLVHAVILLARGQAARAIPLLEKVAALPDLPETIKAYALFYLGVARVQRRELGSAADALERALAFGIPREPVQPYLSWVCQQLAIDAVLSNDLAGAARWFGRMDKLGGPDAPAARANAALALVLAGQAAARDGDYESAVAAWSSALALKPRDAALRQNLAIALERADRTDEAVVHWKELVRQMPHGTGKDAGKASAERQASADDVEMLKHIRALAHQHLADLYLEQDEVDLAIEQFERALQVLPSDVEIRRELAITLLDEGRFARAIPHLERVAATASATANDHVDLGMALISTGREQPGLEHLEKALALEPDHPVARLGLGKTLANRVLKSPKAPNALAEAQRALALLPSPLVFFGLMALGAAQLAMGDRRAAEKSFKEAIKSAPDKPAAQVKVGEIYFDAGETKAVTIWTRAMKEAKKIPCAYANLVRVWAKARDSERCEQSLAASLAHNEDEALDAIEKVCETRELQPFIRQVMLNVAAFTTDLIQRGYLAQGLIYAGDMPGARTVLKSVAREAVEKDDYLAIRLATGLDLKYKYNLLDRGTAELVQSWIDAHPGILP